MSIAHELITRGWTQHHYTDNQGRVCLVGACIKSEVNTVAAIHAVEQALPVRHVSWWNDKPGRTFDEVLRVAKEADEILGL